MQKEMDREGDLDMRAPLGPLDKLTSPHLAEQRTLKTSRHCALFPRAELLRPLGAPPGMSG